MPTARPSIRRVAVQFEAPEIFRILTVIQGLEERGRIDPALYMLQEKLNEALPFSVSFNDRISESD